MSKDQDREYTEQEVKALRAGVIKEYKDENALLKLESENAKYKADIAQDRLREMMAHIRLAELHSSQQEAPEQKEEVKEEVSDEK